MINHRFTHRKTKLGKILKEAHISVLSWKSM